MTDAAAGNFLGTEYDAFLFAAIGEDGNGMVLSVVSALVRLDLDPWQEAADLARLPFDSAVKRLAGRITALPDQDQAHRDSPTIAARVIALLPRGRNSTPKLLGSVTGSRSRPNVIWFGLVVVLAIVVFGQLFLASRPSGVDGSGHAVLRERGSAHSGYPQ